MPDERHPKPVHICYVERGGCVTRLGCGADEELVAWVPGRLLLEAARDAASMHALLDGPLRQGLFPAKLSADALARQWGAVWLAAPAAERRALQRLLNARSRIQAAVAKLLAAREEARSGASSEQTQAKLQVRAFQNRLPGLRVLRSCNHA